MWRQIPLQSPRFVSAFTEETWALYLGGDAERALGHAHALRMPSLRAGGSDAEVVRAMIQLEHCQWDALEHTLARFLRQMGPQLAGAERSVQMAESDDDAFIVLVAVRSERSRIPRAVRAQVREALGAEALGRDLANVRSIDRELARLGHANLDANLLTEVQQSLTVARALAVHRSVEHTRARLRGLHLRLRERANRMDTIELELNAGRRHELSQFNPRPMEPAEGGPITTVAAGQRWPWDGEWWSDEVLHFRQTITNRCGR